MNPPRPTADDFLRIGPRVRVLPIIHGSGDFAIRVREELLARPYDCLAVPLPPSFQDDVEAAIERLPAISVVVQRDADDDAEPGFSYVPIDPCQGVIAALRVAIGERIAREFIDLETPELRAERGRLSRSVRPQEGQPRGLRRGRPAGDPAAVARPARRPNRLDGRAAPRARRRVPVDPVRLLAARLALDPRRLHAQARAERARAVLRADPDVRRRPEDPDLRARRAAVPDRPVRARPARADARRQPVGRRRQGDGPRTPATGSRRRCRRSPSGSRRNCSRSTSATSATSR